MLSAIAVLMHVPLVLFLGSVLYRRWFQRKPMPGAVRILVQCFKLVALIALLGMASCTSVHELAAAHGPLFALNPGHWQPTPKDLEAAPAVVNP